MLALAFDRRDRLDHHRLTARVPTAGRADVVRALQLVTVLALHERRRADGKMRAALTLARLGYFSLGNAHAELLDRYVTGRRSIARPPIRGKRSVVAVAQQCGQAGKAWVDLLAAMDMVPRIPPSSALDTEARAV